VSYTFAFVMLILLGAAAIVGILVALFRYFHLRGLDKQALDAFKKDVQDKVNKL
jgi:hypothetical protein